MGLEEDLMLKGDNYQWLGSLFYIGKPTRWATLVARLCTEVIRIPGMGTTCWSTTSMATSGKIQRCLYCAMGRHVVLFCSSQKLPRCGSGALHSGNAGSKRHARLCPHDRAGACSNSDVRLQDLRRCSSH